MRFGRAWSFFGSIGLHSLAFHSNFTALPSFHHSVAVRMSPVMVLRMEKRSETSDGQLGSMCGLLCVKLP